MGRKRRDEDQPPTQDKTGQDGQEQDGAEHRSRRGRNLAVLLALAGGAAYLVRRNQRKAELDEGIWHEAPAPAPASSTPTA
jgi:hypothetical protein